MMFCMSASVKDAVRCINPSHVVHLEALTTEITAIHTTASTTIFVVGSLEQITNNMMWAMGSTRQYKNLEDKYNTLLEGK